ncbi:alkaline phosphatase D family protein [Hydrogenophaga sp. OTU3427]|uniref:alkaline phosphatase D family protein n=1 Tax=Hydrogenophaga sp. OTU3427 TaxID=3043856 RepID=UPI00313E6790
MEALLDSGEPLACDVLVVGSGYGGSFAATELAESGAVVWVMERGKEYALGEFAEDIGSLPGHVRYQRGGDPEPTGDAQALLDFRLFDKLSVLVGNGLGGGSLINAGVALAPARSVFNGGAWPGRYREGGAEQDALYAAMAEVGQRLQAQPLDGARDLRKFKALDRLGQSLGCLAEPVPITVASRYQVSPAGLSQPACIRCGNCFTGCNVGAKNTLVSHVIPIAARHGARFFTGAVAQEVRPGPGGRQANGLPMRWSVRFRRAAVRRPGADPASEDFTVHAHTVILAAGTLGSTEILLRSPEVSHSPRLGAGFSTNGDVLAMGWGMAQAVDGVSGADPQSASPSQQVGPTIVGTVRTAVQVGGRERPVLVQDGAVPSALASAVIALCATLSLPHRYTRDGGTGYHEALNHADPLTTPADIGRHALLLLGMGLDDTEARLRLAPQGSDESGRPRPATLDIVWPDGQAGGRAPFYQAFHDLLSRRARGGTLDGFDGGDFLANPAWRPMPDDFSLVDRDKQPHGLVTVHPLGGCGMADDARDGVVDWRGAVFSGDSGSACHDGLHVLDGSVLSTAVGVNPFLTISALAVLAARDMSTAMRPLLRGERPPVPRGLPSRQPAVTRHERVPDGPVVLRFEERLQGRLVNPHRVAWVDEVFGAAPGGPQAGPDTDELQGRQWVLRVSLHLNVHDWLADPGMALPAKVDVFRNPTPEELTLAEDALDGAPVLSGSGQVRLLAHDPPSGTWQRWGRAWEAVLTYVKRRGLRDLARVSGSQQGLVAAVCGFWRAGLNLGERRRLVYDFRLATPGPGGLSLQASGEKRLAYARDHKSLWEALTELDLSLAPVRGGPEAQLALQVDLVDMVKHRRLQIEQAPHTPAALVGLAAFGAFWVRALLQSHFWSFRGASYQKLRPPTPPEPASLWPTIGGATVEVKPEILPLAVPRQVSDGDTIELQLTRYTPTGGGPAEGGARHVLLIHGLAHGSGVFSTETVGTHNMATAFLEDGNTVWLLDHRLSNRLPHADADHSIDELARHDIPAAVAHVHRAAGGVPIDVFAHCVGAAAFAMAVLSGRLRAQGASMVRAAAIHAVHPWVVPSVSNQFSGALAALYKDWLGPDVVVDPVPPAGAGGLGDEVIDRLAATLPWPAAELPHHRRHEADAAGGFETCNRMTLFYGREWVHANLSEATHRQLAQMVGKAGIEVFRQLYFIIARGRLTNRQGANAYMTPGQLAAHWTFPTLFCHGRENRVFDPRSAVRAWHRLRAFREARDNAEPVRLFIAPGYGHMDFLFGREAHRDIYPHLVQFLRQPHDDAGCQQGSAEADNARIRPALRDRGHATPRRPLTGPLLQVEVRDGVRQLVVWTEQALEPTHEPGEPWLLTDTDPPTALPGWRAERLRMASEDAHIHSANATFHGPGAFWVGRLSETADGDFQRLSRLRLVLRRETENDCPAELADAPCLVLGDLPWWRRWTGQPRERPVSWLAASCRWPGTPFDRRKLDLMSRAMHAHLTHPSLPVDALLMLGDQIYADAQANVADTTELEERGPQRYREAWSGPHTRQLLASLPTYMVLDDHEYADNWQGGERPGQDAAFVNGFEAALAYQWRRNVSPGDGPALGESSVRGFWHRFDVGGIPAFAADTRSERHPAVPGSDDAMGLMSSAQRQAIEQWLLAHRDEPKLLCSGSVFGVPERAELSQPALRQRSDGWLAYPQACEWLCTFLVRHQIRHLILIAGDYHLSAVAELRIQAPAIGPDVAALSVVCSGWNAPLPFVNAHARDFPQGAPVAMDFGSVGLTLESRIQVLSEAQRQFAKLSLAPVGTGWELGVRIFNEDGEQIAGRMLPLGDPRASDPLAQPAAGPQARERPVPVHVDMDSMAEPVPR